MAASAEAISQMALDHLGEASTTISSISSPTSAAEIRCARWYPVALDKAFRDFEPLFATRKVLLTLHDETSEGTTEVNYDNFPLLDEWAFLYDVPTSMVKLMKILPEGAVHNLPSQDFELFSFTPAAVTSASADTSAETITFTEEHYLVDTDTVTVASTTGGLTAGTTYYVHKVSDFVISLHTTAANALADTSRVNITATLAIEFTPTKVWQCIATDVEDAYADYIVREATETLYTEEFTAAVSYLLASYIAPALVKGKTGLALQAQMLSAYRLMLAGGKANDQNERQITERYRTRPAGWISNR